MNSLEATLNQLGAEAGGSVKPSGMGRELLPDGRNTYQVRSTPNVEWVEKLGTNKITLHVRNDDGGGDVEVLVPRPGDTHEYADLFRESFAAFAHAIGVPLDQQGGVNLSLLPQFLPAAQGKWVELMVTTKETRKIVEGEERIYKNQRIKWAPATPVAQQQSAVQAAAVDFGATQVATRVAAAHDDIPF